MKSFFRALEWRGVAYLLISGQACVMYGASTFSEDFDLWVRPAAGNLEALVGALRDVGARVYKLTPPLDMGLLRRGHALHFTVPQEQGPEGFIDVMLRPPRVGGFDRAARRAEHLPTCASAAGCARLLTEDFQHGSVIDGVRIENPFRSAGA